MYKELFILLERWVPTPHTPRPKLRRPDCCPEGHRSVQMTSQEIHLHALSLMYLNRLEHGNVSSASTVVAHDQVDLRRYRAPMSRSFLKRRTMRLAIGGAIRIERSIRAGRSTWNPVSCRSPLTLAPPIGELTLITT